MKTLKSYNVQIWVGLREQYTETIHSIDDVRDMCDNYVNEVKDCVTITPTEYRYVNGSEPGVVVGWIQYPRFPRKRKEILRRALKLADILMRELGQFKVTVVTQNKSYMLENDQVRKQ